MSLRRLETGPELAKVEFLAGQWSESPHHPALSEETRLQLRSGRGAVLFSDNPEGMATLTTTKRPEIGMVEVAVPGQISAADFWDRAEPEVIAEAIAMGHRAIELLTWDAGLRGELGDRGWQPVRAINRGSRTNGPTASPGAGPEVEAFDRERDIDGLLEVNNLAFESHPEAGNWDRSGLGALLEEPWFDPAGLLVTREATVVTGFSWTKLHPDGVGEIYLLAVRPDHFGRGLGRALVTAGIQHLTGERGCQRTIVYWDVSNKAASNLYQSVGFSVDQVGEVFRHRL
jgi:mycothiol synthase